MYALLTGRVSTITRSVALGEETLGYGAFPRVDRNRQREYGLFAQDTWRIRPGLTLTLGVRYERQGAFENLSGIYTRVGYEGLFGISGVGNLFNPKASGGVTPVFLPTASVGGAYNTPGFFDPSVGFAWVLPQRGGKLGWLTGRQGTVGTARRLRDRDGARRYERVHRHLGS
jgi:outer membrane receptor protein involved in Fe transport